MPVHKTKPKLTLEYPPCFSLLSIHPSLLFLPHGAPGMFSHLLQDWHANADNRKGRFIAFAFRLGQLLKAAPTSIRWLFIPYFAFYSFMFAWVFGVEIPLRTRIGAGVRILHGQGLVVHSDAVIGRNCHLKQCTTIGFAHGGSPVIGDNVNIGSNSVILGNIQIGNNVVIGAGAVVVKDLPSDCIAVGNPARVVRQNRVT